MYDVIVVGARCAGATTAMLLARRGHRVLVLDRASFPSDSPMSTHLVHPPGIRRLKRWGLLDRLHATGCPPIRDYGMECGPVSLMAPLPPDEEVAVAYAPRRFVLDALLVDAAIEAGAEVRTGASVQGLLTDDRGVVRGVRFRSGGREHTEHATVVVGADGTRSKVARQVGAGSYLERPSLLSSWWTYFADLPVDNVPTFRGDHKYGFAWPTNDGLVLVGMAWRRADFRLLRTGPEESFFGAYGQIAPEFTEQLRGARRAERWRTGDAPNFFRTAAGPGWALVGDAGYCRDPVTASGITEALRAADFLADALHDGLSGARSMAEATADYERRRNAASRPYFEYTTDFALLLDYSPTTLQLLHAATLSPEHASGLVGLFGQTTSPVDFFSAANIRRLLDLVPAAETPSWRLRALRAVLTGPARHSPAAERLGRTMINKELGQLGDYLRVADREPAPPVPQPVPTG